MTEAQAIAERLEQASQAGVSPRDRRKIMLEAAAFIREQNALPAKNNTPHHRE